MKMITVVAIAVLLLALTACVPMPKPGAQAMSANTFVFYKVEFQPNGPPPMRTTTPNQKCTKGTGSREGCMRFDKGEYGSILFALTSETEGKKCGDSGISWVITKVEAAESGNLDTNKSTDWDKSLSSWVRDDYFPMDDPDKGVLIDLEWDEARTIAGINNKNESAKEYDLWYRITATKCNAESDGTHNTNTSDPRIENDGR